MALCRVPDYGHKRKACSGSALLVRGSLPVKQPGPSHNGFDRRRPFTATPSNLQPPRGAVTRGSGIGLMLRIVDVPSPSTAPFLTKFPHDNLFRRAQSPRTLSLCAGPQSISQHRQQGRVNFILRLVRARWGVMGTHRVGQPPCPCADEIVQQREISASMAGETWQLLINGTPELES